MSDCSDCFRQPGRLANLGFEGKHSRYQEINPGMVPISRGIRGFLGACVSFPGHPGRLNTRTTGLMNRVSFLGAK